MQTNVTVTGRVRLLQWNTWSNKSNTICLTDCWKEIYTSMHQSLTNTTFRILWKMSHVTGVFVNFMSINFHECQQMLSSHCLLNQEHCYILRYWYKCKHHLCLFWAASFLAASCRSCVSHSSAGSCTYRTTDPRMKQFFTDSCNTDNISQ